MMSLITSRHACRAGVRYVFPGLCCSSPLRHHWTYHDIAHDQFNNPRNADAMRSDNAQVVRAVDYKASCGDDVLSVVAAGLCGLLVGTGATLVMRRFRRSTQIACAEEPLLTAEIPGAEALLSLERTR